MLAVENLKLLVIMRKLKCKIQGALEVVHEINQFDIPNHQLLATSSQSKAKMWTNIGEAKITQTIFGKARVRVICAQDKYRRAWLLATLLATLLAALVWQGWVASQYTELPPAPVPLSARIRISAPVFQSEYIPPEDTSKSVNNRFEKSSPLDSYNLITRREPPPQPSGLLPADNTVVKPSAASPLITNKPQAILPATNTKAPKLQTDTQSPLSSPIQPVSPTIDSKPVVNKPTVMAPPAVPSTVDPALPPSTTDANQKTGQDTPQL